MVEPQKGSGGNLVKGQGRVFWAENNLEKGFEVGESLGLGCRSQSLVGCGQDWVYLS